MKIEKLRKNNSKKYFLCGLISVVVLTVAVTFITSKASYRMTASIPLTEGKVVSSPYDINIVALYLDNIEQDNNTVIPSGYKINETNSYCYKGTNKNNKDSNAELYTNILGEHVFTGVSKSSKCILYLDKINYEVKTMSELLNTHYKYKSKRTSENKDFNVPYGETTYGMIFEAEDDDGISYYFAGNPLDNWVEFGGYYWRIIRVNGDGSIRMIYQGRTEDENGNKLEPQITGKETTIGTSAFNEKYDDNAYVGYMYGTPNSSTYEATHENKNGSTIKQVLDNWYNNSGLKELQNKYIDINARFCEDKTAYTTYNPENTIEGNGVKMTTTYYGAMLRLRPNNDDVTISTEAIKPTYKCTIKINGVIEETKYNNNVLKNVVGLITADEASYAGMVANWKDVDVRLLTNYLNVRQAYWSMSPSYYYDTSYKAVVLFIGGTGIIGNNIVSNEYGVRPVINLRSDVTFTGDGTKSNPYKVV
ncbi:MAG: hypothetical protein NC483_07365, partial [Ruminococcus sp.]|nr:hypothetical protein [Ruminococcus sp.]